MRVNLRKEGTWALFVASLLVSIRLAAHVPQSEVNNADVAYSTLLTVTDSLASVHANAGAAESELAQLEREWSAAYLKHDTNAVERILADDYMGIDGRAVMSSKAQEIQETKASPPGTPAPNYQVLDETITDIKVRLYGEVAVVNARSIEQVKFNGKAREVQYRRTTVWVRRDGRWQCVSFHASRILN